MQEFYATKNQAYFLPSQNMSTRPKQANRNKLYTFHFKGQSCLDPLLRNHT